MRCKVSNTRLPCPESLRLRPERPHFGKPTYHHPHARVPQAMNEPDEPAGGAAAAAKKKKNKKTEKKPLSGADNAPLRRRIALAQSRAPRASRDAAQSEDWAQALIAACTVAPAGAPTAVPRTYHTAGPWLPSVSTGCARVEPVTQSTTPTPGARQLERHAMTGFRHRTDFMDECIEQPGTPPRKQPKMLHAMPAARSAPGSASGAPPSQAGEAGLAQATRTTACLMLQAGSRHSLASVDECQPRFLPPTPAPHGTPLPLGGSFQPVHGQACWPHSDESQAMPGQPRQEERFQPRPHAAHRGQAMPTLHGPLMHQAAHAPAASITYGATTSSLSGRGDRAPPPKRQDYALWVKVNINTSGLLDEALDSV